MKWLALFLILATGCAPKPDRPELFYIAYECVSDVNPHGTALVQIYKTHMAFVLAGYSPRFSNDLIGDAKVDGPHSSPTLIVAIDPMTVTHMPYMADQVKSFRISLEAARVTKIDLIRACPDGDGACLPDGPEETLSYSTKCEVVQ
jgi:hypothetical protein